MHIAKLKVRPKKKPPVNLCARELSTMLGCWAATSDFQNAEPCAVAAQSLFQCMRETPFQGKQHKPTINYHLARLRKNLK